MGQLVLMQQMLDEEIARNRNVTRRNTRSYAPRRQESESIWIGSLHKDISDQELLEAFRPYGAIKSNIVRKPGEEKNGMFYGFVQFDKPESKQKVLELKNKELKIKGHKIVIGDCRSEKELQNQQLKRDRCIWIGNIPKAASDE